jgi:hypothetical protein
MGACGRTSKERIVLDNFLNSSLFILVGGGAFATLVVALMPEPHAARPPQAHVAAAASQPVVVMPRVVVTGHRPAPDATQVTAAS